MLQIKATGTLSFKDASFEVAMPKDIISTIKKLKKLPETMSSLIIQNPDTWDGAGFYKQQLIRSIEDKLNQHENINFTADIMYSSVLYDSFQNGFQYQISNHNSSIKFTVILKSTFPADMNIKDKDAIEALTDELYTTLADAVPFHIDAPINPSFTKIV